MEATRSGVGELLGREVDRDLRRPMAAGSQPYTHATGLAHDPFADRDDQAGFFGDADELIRTDHALLRMIPAQQGFQSLQAAAAQAQLRLVEHFQLVLVQRAAKVVFHEQLVVGLGMQRLGEDLDLVLAVGFRLVQRLPGMLHQGFRIASVQRGAGQAQRGTDADQLLVDEQRPVEGMQNLISQAKGVVDLLAVQQDGELVAGEACQHRAARQAVAQPAGEIRQQLVARLMAEAVVDPLEVIDVDQEQAEPGLAVTGKALLEAADEKRPVAEAGEVIGIGQSLDMLLRQLAVGDVFVDADVVRQLAILT